ncbi:MAG: hypothetical protein LBI42_03145 [Chitinispirillales bacterium]|jgi:hypothetical protein|nr:hypothetical protein [Chitinispirillales bacterium]
MCEEEMCEDHCGEGTECKKFDEAKAKEIFDDSLIKMFNLVSKYKVSDDEMCLKNYFTHLEYASKYWREKIESALQIIKNQEKKRETAILDEIDRMTGG